MNEMLMPGGERVGSLQDRATERWHRPEDAEPEAATDDFEALILAQHRANFELWHEEDEARDPGATDARIAEVKRAIDRLNQRRNDLVETMDGRLSEAVRQAPDAPLHSETPGMMVDRLSIMALKIFHTREETVRASASEAQREKNRRRLAVLMEQRADLAGCLDALVAEISNGTRRFKIYRQMKMYNDPELNPVIYGRGAGGGS